MKELKEIYASGTKIKLEEKVVDVKPFIVKDIPFVVEVISKGFNEIFKESADDIQIAKNVVDFLLKNLDDAYKLIEITTGLDKDYFQDKSLETLIFVINEVVEVNWDFLSQKVMSRVEGLKKKIANNKVGLSPSKS